MCESWMRVRFHSHSPSTNFFLMSLLKRPVEAFYSTLFSLFLIQIQRRLKSRRPSTLPLINNRSRWSSRKATRTMRTRRRKRPFDTGKSFFAIKPKRMKPKKPPRNVSRSKFLRPTQLRFHRFRRRWLPLPTPYSASEGKQRRRRARCR